MRKAGSGFCRLLKFRSRLIAGRIAVTVDIEEWRRAIASRGF
jgi:hypothetical protein